MIGRYTNCYLDTARNVQGLMEGLVVCMDPSVGSHSSMPGYAIYRGGDLVTSGTLDINPDMSLPDRLRTLANHMRKLYNDWEPDVLVYEEIPAQRHGGGNAQAHASLLKAVGVILSVPGPRGYVGILPVSWKKLVTADYVKGDEEDAIQIGRIIIELAKQIQETQVRKTSKKTKSKKK